MNTLSPQHRQDAQRVLIEAKIRRCDPTNPNACGALAQEAAQVANEHFMSNRFGWFGGDGVCVVYSNMGIEYAPVRDRFRRELQKAGVAELAVAVWPRTNTASSGKHSHYTWAVMVSDPDGERWRGVALDAWNDENC